MRDSKPYRADIFRKKSGAAVSDGGKIEFKYWFLWKKWIEGSREQSFCVHRFWEHLKTNNKVKNRTFNLPSTTILSVKDWGLYAITSSHSLVKKQKFKILTPNFFLVISNYLWNARKDLITGFANFLRIIFSKTWRGGNQEKILPHPFVPLLLCPLTISIKF